MAREPELHPLNRGFRWQQPEGPFRRISAAQARDYADTGCFVLEDAFGADEVRAAIAEIDPFEAQVEAFLRTRPDGRLFIARAGELTFTTHLVTRSPRLRDFCAGPVFQDLGHDLIGPDVRLYWDQAVYKKPGTADEFPWHQDNGYTYVEPQQYLTCWVALDDATVENGCPWVVPGVHRRGTLRHRMTELGWQCLERPENAVPVPVPAGGIAVFSSLTPHRTGPNRTDALRRAYIVQLAPDGACLVRDDGAREPCAAPERQYPILVAGRPPPRAAA
ncbi:MAG: phytanoyl-CoA dioxygenase family protein [Myxococcota bacterium]|nr:phytanoyl-CoA dioxygenase family protein [Myxococcota bacterium]